MSSTTITGLPAAATLNGSELVAADQTVSGTTSTVKVKIAQPGGIATLAAIGTLQPTQFPGLTGDVTASEGQLYTQLVASGVTAGTYGSATQVPQLTIDGKGRVTAASNVTISGGAGTVTSVGFSAPSLFTVTGSPITSSGTLALSFASAAANLVLASPNGVAGVPALRALVGGDLPASGATAGTYGSSTQVGQFTIDATGRITNATNVTIASGGTGTVTSVGLADSTGLFSITGSPITSSGTLTLASLNSQAAATFLAAPTAAAGAPTFRVIAAADIPQLTATQMPALTGDVTSSAGSVATTLVTSGVTAGTYGSSTQVGQFTVDDKGRITSAANVAISGGGGGTTFTFTPQAAPTLAAGITWGDSTQNALETYINGAKGWLPTVLMVGTAITTVSLPMNTATSILPSTYIGTLTLPANFLVAGKTVRITIRGYVSSSPTSFSQVIPSLVIGSTTVGGSAGNGSGFDTSASLFTLQYTLTCLTTGTSGTVMTSLDAGADGTQSAVAPTSTRWSDTIAGASSTVNTTVANALNVKLNCLSALTVKITHAMIEVIA